MAIELKERDKIAVDTLENFGFCGLTSARQAELRRAIERGINCWEDRPLWLVMVVERLPKKWELYTSVNHTAGEYVRGNVTTNSIESVFAVMKRGVIGVYHHTSRKHLARYVDEFTFRLNDGNVKQHTMQRLGSFVDATVGRRITYGQLTA